MQRLQRARAWVAARPPSTFLLGGWLVFVLGCYPGYLSLDSALELYEVRGGSYSDSHPALATLLWRAFEWIMAGPFPMLLLQSALLLFGAAALLRKVLSPRAAALGAVAVLLFPPVSAAMAPIWPDPLMAGALVAGLAALLEPRRGWKLVGIALFVLACNCRFTCIAAVVPLLAIVPTSLIGWRRVVAIAGVAIAVEGAAIAADRILIDNDDYFAEQALMLPDTVAVLRRHHVTGERSLETAFAGVPLLDAHRLREITGGKHDPSDWWGLAHGDRRSFDPVIDPDEAWALYRDWRHAVLNHPVDWLLHREQMAKRLVGWTEPVDPIFDDLGDFDLLAPMHHRAIPSTWELATRAVAHAADSLRLFRAWLYLVAAIALLVFMRVPLVRALTASGLAYELAMALFAGGFDYRFSHWLVTATCIAGAAAALSRRYAR
ncbi:MAG TPA: hypothetical protein VGG74_30180 [Kofleriaceae bacterium]|jgi:hypothetical protein